MYDVLDFGTIAQSITVRRFEKSICSCHDVAVMLVVLLEGC